MAHWAQVDDNNVVTQVVVGSNNDPDEGYQWLVDNIGGRWIKTSYNNNIRKIFAAVGMTYDEANDFFVPRKTAPSYVWDQETHSWFNPITKPAEDPDTILIWFEEDLSWKRFNKETLQQIDL